ncbi:MAG: 30S ribosomal protein S8e [Thaumarchaeota archaeon]|nr:30S ribosomal protein S8e [Nitrososphaerota archaeon]
MVKAVENLRKKKLTGGKRRPNRSRRAFEADNYAFETALAPAVRAPKRMRGGKLSFGLRSANEANVFDASTGKTVKTKIVRVTKNPANREYERRGVITRGATIETDIGAAKVTSRPSDDGVVNAVLIK